MVCMVGTPKETLHFGRPHMLAPHWDNVETYNIHPPPWALAFKEMSILSQHGSIQRGALAQGFELLSFPD